MVALISQIFYSASSSQEELVSEDGCDDLTSLVGVFVKSLGLECSSFVNKRAACSEYHQRK